MEKVIGFVDESGAHGFNFTGNNTHFVINVLLVEENKLYEVQSGFERIKSVRHANTELKSSQIGGRDDLRQNLLSEINSLPFTYFSVIIDKTKIYQNSGLQYKPSFYKFLYGLLYNKLYRTFQNIEIVADQMGSQEFMQGFKAYIDQNYKMDLFSQEQFSFSESHNTLLLQLSDILAGTINRYYSGKSALVLESLLPGKGVGSIFWPSVTTDPTPDEHEMQDEFKDVIKNVCLLRVESYLNNSNSNNEYEIMRVRFLEYLRSVYLFNQKTRYVPTHEILSHLNSFGNIELSEQVFRSQVIGQLRDEGVIISSSNSGGYKIPYSKKDLMDFVDLCNTRIKPLANRLKKCNDDIKLATSGKLDLLASPEYVVLRNLTS